MHIRKLWGDRRVNAMQQMPWCMVLLTEMPEGENTLPETVGPFQTKICLAQAPPRRFGNLQVICTQFKTTGRFAVQLDILASF